jgi:murein L,D-transpeptidase YcbB/YkuD
MNNKTNKLKLIKFFTLICCMLTVAPVIADDTAITKQIRQKIEDYRNTGHLSVSGVDIASKQVLPDLYEHRSYRAAWTNQERIEDLIQMVGRAEEEGLLPQDYHYNELVLLRNQNSEDASDIANLDILLTDSLIRYGYHQNFGKVNPVELDSNWNLTRNLGGKDPVTIVQGAIDSEGIRQYISDVLERGPYYRRLKKLLAEYRAQAANEVDNHPNITPGPTLKRGMQGERVAMLRKRLQSSGDLDDISVTNLNLFDETLEKAVKNFQQNADIDDDGIVGAGTLAQLNSTLQNRIDKIRVNMERIRWIFRDIRDNKDFVIVNIAGFETMLVRNHEVVWKTRSQVGRTYYKTPVFRADMEYVQFNPTWTVPPGILKRDIIPKIKFDPNSLAANDMQLIDNKTGKAVDPNTIDWAKLDGRFPYQVVQRPGPKNPLGQVKFIYPNRHSVFLHDTTHKEGFTENVRAFSAGCIRIQHPFEFAELVLNDPEWDMTNIQKTVDAKKIKTVYLKQQLPVLVLYWTVVPTGKDGPRFLPDIYQRDAAILKELNEPFKFVAPDDLSNL